jgi:DNA-binding transcriptional regulator YhcF (GntR family)
MYHSQNQANKQANKIEKYKIFDGNRYLQLLTSTKECKLSHEQLKILSERVYRHGQGKPAKLSVRYYAEQLRMNRRTVRRAIKDMGECWCDDPVAVQPTWFAERHPDGAPRTYRYYLLRPDADLSELDNRVLMMLWSLASEPAIPITRGRLARMLRASRVWVSRSLRHLETLKLVRVAESGQTIFIFPPQSFDRWQDEKFKRKPKKPKDAKADLVLTEDSLGCLVDMYYNGEDAQYINDAIKKAIGAMKPHWSMREIAGYWQTVLSIGATPDDVLGYIWNHESHLRRALATHERDGYGPTCSINLLADVAKRHLRVLPLPWLT